MKIEKMKDLIVAEKVTDEKFLAKYARGLVCMPIIERLDELDIGQMVSETQIIMKQLLLLYRL